VLSSEAALQSNKHGISVKLLSADFTLSIKNYLILKKYAMPNESRPAQGRKWKILCHKTEIPYLLWNPKFHVHKGPPLVSILSQVSLNHTLFPCFSVIHYNIIFPSMSMSSKWFYLSGIPTKTLHAFLTSPMYNTCPCPSHYPWLHHSVPVLILLGIQLSDTLNPCSSLNVRGKFYINIK
jgi:hypothetical protein